MSLADLLIAHQRHSNVIARPGTLIVACKCGWRQEYPGSERGSGYRLWALHVAQSDQSVRTITSGEALNALPTDAVVLELNSEGCVWIKEGYRWCFGGGSGEFDVGTIQLPALVLHLPEVTS